MTLLHIEPPGIPPLQRSIQRHSNVFARYPIAELQIHTADHLRTAPSFLIQPEKVSKEIEMGKNAKIGLIEMDKHGNVQNNVRMQIAQAQSPELQ